MLNLKTVDGVMLEIYERIISNKPFDTNLKLYSKEQIESVIKFFEKKEDYEKCQLLHNFIKNRFNHNLGYEPYFNKL